MATAPLPKLGKPVGWSHAESPFHEGEQQVQERIGVRERVERLGRNLVRDFMPDEHRAFFEDLPFMTVGSIDAVGGLWASLLVGAPGFVQALGARRLRIEAQPLPGDPLASNLRVGAPLGLLGLELSTRRRNRVNGRVLQWAQGNLELGVEQSFGNCKQYIQSRAGFFGSPAALAAPTAETAVLSGEAAQVLQRTDTSFIATASRAPELGGTQGVDVSHRGGRPGFIRVESVDGASRLTLPDFYGNFVFNTFGNLEVNPRAGLLALDFVSGAVLSLTGTARVIWDGPAVAAFEGAERLLEYQVQNGWLWQSVLLGWSEPEQSPQLHGTGTW